MLRQKSTKERGIEKKKAKTLDAGPDYTIGAVSAANFVI